ncbi:hypothetical protein ACFX15_000290 [Malus domestica]
MGDVLCISFRANGTNRVYGLFLPCPSSDYNSLTRSMVQSEAGILKINVNGAWDERNRLGGVGIIIRDYLGSFVAARSTRFPFVFSPQQAEALATREGVFLTSEMSFNGIVIEDHSLQIVNALLDSTPSTSLIGPITTKLNSLRDEGDFVVQSILRSHKNYGN